MKHAPSATVLPEATLTQVAGTVTRAHSGATPETKPRRGRFTAWCRGEGHAALPAHPLIVAAYLLDTASTVTEAGERTYAPTTLLRWSAGIGYHRRHPAILPRADELVTAALSGIRREHVAVGRPAGAATHRPHPHHSREDAGRRCYDGLPARGAIPACARSRQTHGPLGRRRHRRRQHVPSPVARANSAQRPVPAGDPARGHFLNEQAALECLYPATRALDPTGNGRARWTSRWKGALNVFAITFEGRTTPNTE